MREGHGDLRGEHICLTDDIPIFDCIEFNEKLRTCDVASEIGFLAMDLDFLNAAELSEHLAARYAEDDARRSSRDAVCRSTNVTAPTCGARSRALKAQEKEVHETEHERALTAAQRYFFLAGRYVRGSSRPTMLIVCGLAGSGKSTVARMLGDLTGFEVLSSDVIRKRLARGSADGACHSRVS